jgi:hypothetical protein
LKNTASSTVLNCQVLNQLVDSQPFASLLNRYHQWLSDVEEIELIHVSDFVSDSVRIFIQELASDSFAGKQIEVWDVHATHRIG